MVLFLVNFPTFLICYFFKEVDKNSIGASLIVDEKCWFIVVYANGNLGFGVGSVIEYKKDEKEKTEE